MKRTNAICDHINKWSKRKRENMTDEMLRVVLYTIKTDEASGSDS